MSKEEAIEFALDYLAFCLKHRQTNGNPDREYYDPEDLPNPDFKLFEVTAHRGEGGDDWTIFIDFPRRIFGVYSGEPGCPDESVDVHITAELD